MTHPRTTFAALAVLAALLGLLASIYAYLSPETGVDDTAGPILSGLGHAALAALAVLAVVLRGGGGLLCLAALVVGLATAFAAYLLAQPMILLPAIVALAALPFGLMLGDGA